MQIREKLSLIVIVSILLTSIPAAIWVSAYSKEKLLNREVNNLLAVTQNQVDITSQKLSYAEPKLKGLARLLQSELDKPVTKEEIDKFYQTIELNSDGVWRNKKDQFDGQVNAGIFIPDSADLTDKQKVMHLRIKQVMDVFGSSANRVFENVWYLSPDLRSEVIFDSHYPQFIFTQQADNDYTQTPWVSLTSPSDNPDKQYTFTPPLFDPVNQVWMVSALYPLYVSGKWVGSLGEDMQLSNVLGFTFNEQQLYPDTQHFLLDKQGNFILAGQWQKQLESGDEKQVTDFLDKENALKVMLKQPVKDSPQIASKDIIVNGEKYIVISMSVVPVDWRYFKLIPIDDLIEPVNRLLAILIAVLFAVTIFSGWLITVAVNKNVISRITRLTREMTRFESGQKVALTAELKGNDEITTAARAFDSMAERIDSYLTRIAESKKSLAESESRWKLALESTGDGVWDVDLDAGTASYSERWKKMLGYMDDSFPDTLDETSEYIHPEDREQARLRFRGYISGEYANYQDEFRMLCGDGSWKWIMARGMIIKRDKDLQPLRMIGTSTDISYFKKIQDELRTNTAKLRELLEYSPIAVRIVTNTTKKIVFANKRYAELVNQDKDKLNDLNPFAFYVDPTVVKTYLNHIAEGKTIYNQLTELNIYGEGTKWTLASYLPIKYGGEECNIGWFYDITDRLKNEEALRLHASVFDDAWEGILITDKDNRIISVNRAFSEITGYTQEELIGEDPKILASGRQGAEFYEEMWECIHTEGRWRGEIWNRKKNGEFFAEILTVSAIENDQGEITNYLGLFVDITEIKKTEHLLVNMAHYDALTQLANRTLLSDRLEQAIAIAKRSEKLLAVCFLDLDGFKPVNDEFGHEIGDKLLIAVAERLAQVTRSGDTAARMGGDEFVVLISNINNIDELDPILTRLSQKIAEPIKINHRKHHVTASIGVAIYPLDNVDGNTLIRHADLAMYEAKQAGRDGYHIFDAKLDQQMHEYHSQLERLHLALIGEEFRLYYQPKVDLRHNRVVGVEALIRWQHPERGLLGAMEFLPIIEDHEFSIELGDWVLKTAFNQLQTWHENNLHIQVSINVSARQIQHDAFLNKLESLLKQYKTIAADDIELEILETSALETVQTAQVVAAASSYLGVPFALDDFGTGYSSLSYLRKLPVRTLKIDQSFIRDMLGNEEDMAIVKGVIELAQVFKRNIIAEGVETEAHFKPLMDMGCDIAQGYAIAKPMPADEVLEWVKHYENAHRKN
ncbi:MAG: EAL domain-containing protein [Pseudomonadota bacterium]|nr:EAL domain-containing protein [Pseudomonadota bacterium]